jgi:hypothetical protein
VLTINHSQSSQNLYVPKVKANAHKQYIIQKIRKLNNTNLIINVWTIL